MKCSYCGAEENLPFDCAYCGNSFCADHRLPENHACPQLWRAKKPSNYPALDTPPSRMPLQYPYGYAPARGRSVSDWLRTEEAKHLSAGVVLVLLVGLSLVSPGLRFAAMPLWAPFLSAGLFAASFLLHEIGHKFTAQRNGLWAEFRMTSFGAMLTIFSIFSPFKIIAPGAVTISGYADSPTFGRVAVLGPVINIVIGIILGIMSLVIPPQFPFVDGPQTSILRAIVASASVTNGFLAVFNLLPFGILDGRKVYLWSRNVWIITFLASIALTLVAYYLL